MKIVYILLMLFVGTLLAECFLFSDSVDREFSTVIDYFELEEPSEQMRNWYKVFKLSEVQKSRLLNANLKEFGYGQWCPFKSSMSFPGHLCIDGNNSLILRASKNGSDDFDGVYIFLDMDMSRLILVYGRTYGM